MQSYGKLARVFTTEIAHVGGMETDSLLDDYSSFLKNYTQHIEDTALLMDIKKISKLQKEFKLEDEQALERAPVCIPPKRQKLKQVSANAKVKAKTQPQLLSQKQPQVKKVDPLEISPELEKVCGKLNLAITDMKKDIPKAKLKNIFLDGEDEQNGIAACGKPIEPNRCQPEGSGGHPGALFTVENGYCAKKQDNEDLFGLKMMCNPDYLKIFGDFSIHYKRMCRDDKGLLRLVMEYAAGDLVKPIGVDIKIGQKTYSRKIVNIKKSGVLGTLGGKRKKKIQMGAIDMLSTSSKRGYRVEGLMGYSGDELLAIFRQEKSGWRGINNKKAKKKESEYRKDIMKSNPDIPFAHLFKLRKDGKSRQCIHNELIKLQSHISNHMDLFKKFRFVGASLVIYTNDTQPDLCRVKLIDLSNSAETSTEDKNKRFVDGFLLGIQNLIKETASEPSPS
jgi:hypothetical protein